MRPRSQIDHCKLSLCMIVRNGGPALGEALASARPFMDELIVVDTGSTDNSRPLAIDSGARVIEFAWCDNFSAARNCSLDHATGDWIFWMDADDILPVESGKELRRVATEHPQRDAAFWVTVEEQTVGRRGQPRVMGHAHVKFFPRHPQIRFRYRIHEQVAPSIRDLGLPIRQTSAVVRHAHADRSAAGEQARSDRNLRLALLDLEERPDDPFVWASVGTTYLFRPGGLPQAIEFLRRSVHGFRAGSQNQLNAYLYLGQALGTFGDRPHEEQVYREALVLFPDDAVLLLRLGNLCEGSGRLDEAAQCYHAVLHRGRVRESAIHVRGGDENLTLQLGQLYVRMGQRERAERLWCEFLKRRPDAATVGQALQRSYAESCSITAEPGK